MARSAAIIRRPLKPDVLSSRVAFAHKAGQELTFLPATKEFKHPPCSYENYAEHRRQRDLNMDLRYDAMNAMQRNATMEDYALIYNIGVDPGVVEVPTKPMQFWSDYSVAYETITGLAQDVGLTAWRPDMIAGGGHIHLEGPKQALSTLAWSAYRFPEISLAFSHWNDHHNAEYLSGPTAWHPMVYAHKEYSTLEQRQFQMPKCWEEAVEQMAFAQRLHSVMLSGKLNDFLPQRTRDQALKEVVSRNAFMVCSIVFQRLVEDCLELPWANYRWLLEENMREKLNKERLSWELANFDCFRARAPDLAYSYRP